jgi:cysteine desulfurase NifS
MGGGGPVGPKAWRECNINELTDLNRYDPISGFPVYKALLCDVRKVSENTMGLKMDSGENAASAVPVSAPPADENDAARIYLDHNATTPLAPEALETTARVLERGFGNPSSIYREGREARRVLDQGRRSTAQLFNCTAKRVLFTGGGSEANNLVLKGTAFSRRGGRNHIVTSKIEHPSVLSACGWLEKNGCIVTYLDVDSAGRVDPDELGRKMTDRTCLVSIMTANNETGTIQPIAELARIAHGRGALFHTDAVQAAGKIPLDVEALGVDFLTMSGHKIYGPKGVGVLFARKGTVFEPLIHGGKQEGGLRAGTENAPAIAGLGVAAELAMKNLPRMATVRAMRDRLEQDIRGLVPGSRVNGYGADRIPNTLNMTLPGLRGESVVLALDRKGVSLSSGSACKSGSPKPSHVLLAIGLTEEEAHCSIRISLGVENTPAEMERTISALAGIIGASKSAVRFVPCR